MCILSASTFSGLEELLRRLNNNEFSLVTTEPVLFEVSPANIEQIGNEIREHNADLTAVAALQVVPMRLEGTRMFYRRYQGMSALEEQRFEAELGQGGDHDTPYHYETYAPATQRMAWLTLLARVQRGELQP